MSDLYDIYTRAPRFRELAEGAEQAIYREDWISAARALGDMSRIFSDLAADVALEASRAGHTNKDIAFALDVPARTLRGLREEAGVAS